MSLEFLKIIVEVAKYEGESAIFLSSLKAHVASGRLPFIACMQGLDGDLVGALVSATSRR
jgi:hypothetical protein